MDNNYREATQVLRGMTEKRLGDAAIEGSLIAGRGTREALGVRLAARPRASKGSEARAPPHAGITAVSAGS